MPHLLGLRYLPQITNFHYLFMAIHKKLQFSSCVVVVLAVLSHKFISCSLVRFFSFFALFSSPILKLQQKSKREFIMKQETLCAERYIFAVRSNLNKKFFTTFVFFVRSISPPEKLKFVMRRIGQPRNVLSLGRREAAHANLLV